MAEDEVKRSPFTTVISSKHYSFKGYDLKMAIDDVGASPKISPPNPTYARIEDIPKPLVDTMRQAYDSGLTVAHIALVFEVPDEWVAMLCEGQPGSIN